MKRKVITYILAIIVIIGVLLCIKMGNRSKDSSLLVVSTYSNFAWVSQYKGSAIFSDGTIYTWDFHGEDYKENTKDYDLQSKDGLEKFILEKGTKKINSVSKSELKEMKKSINEFQDKDYNLDCHGADMGSSIVSIYQDDKEITIRQSGDC